MSISEQDLRAWDKASVGFRSERVARTIDSLFLSEGRLEDEVKAIELSKEKGKFWQNARTTRGISIQEIAIRMCRPDELDAYGQVLEIYKIELGMKPEVWVGPIPKQMSKALQYPPLYELFCLKFGIQPFQEETQKPQA